jgi:hypothetical protein
MKKLIYLLPITILISCNQPKVSINPPSVTQPLLNIPIMIYMEGDSTMVGANGAYPDAITPNNPPNLLQKLLLPKYPNVLTFNWGKGGSMLPDSIDGTDGYGAPLAERLLLIPSNQIILTNDAHNEAGNYYAEGMTTEAATALYSANLENWINIVLAAGDVPVLQEPNPAICWGAQLPPMIMVQHALASKYNITIIEIYNYILAIPNWQNLLIDACVHPSDQLYAIIAQLEYDQLLPIIQSLESNQ